MESSVLALAGRRDFRAQSPKRRNLSIIAFCQSDGKNDAAAAALTKDSARIVQY